MGYTHLPLLKIIIYKTGLINLNFLFKTIDILIDLEWEINFPKAERYLEARMSHAQMKCMLLLLTLHKTFIQPVTEQNGLLPEHIRTHMFWECERDYRNWPEHRLGTKILSVIKNLQQRLFLGWFSFK